jgi:protocatechuate 3,4-dioxygenase beta subunit
MTELAQYRRPTPGTQPDYLFPAYGSTVKRAPSKSLILLPQTLSEITGPVFGHDSVKQGDNDLTLQGPVGERIIVGGRVLDENGRPVPHTLVEVWQANAAGRYAHKLDQHDAPLDPNFTGAGRVMTDEHGRYSFTTIKPGAYPWKNHFNAWRPAHIHFSLFGRSFATRLVTQMYFPNDPLLAFDPIYNSTPDAAARTSMVSSFDWETTQSDMALGYRFDIVLRGRNQTFMEK